MFKTIIRLFLLGVIAFSCSNKEAQIPSSIPVKAIVLNPTSLTMRVGETATLTATVSPNSASNKTVIWSSSNASVATVSDGKVSAVSPGSAEIYAISDDNGMKATCKVTVEPNSVTVPDGLNINIAGITSNGCVISITTSSTKSYYCDIVDKETWDEYGGDVVWDAYISEMKEGGQFNSDYLSSGNDTYTFKGLETNTGYVVFAAFCDKSGIKSGNIFSQSFTTQTGETPGGDDDITSNSISINPINSSNLSQKSVSVSAEVKTVKGTSVIEKGFKYYDVLSPLSEAINWTTIKVSGAGSSYSTTISNLYEYRPYKIKAYAIIRNDSTFEQQEIETELISFKTPKGPATISLSGVWGISCTSVILKVLLTNLGGGAAPKEHSGFLVSTTPNPTIDTQGVIDVTYYPTRNKEGGFKVTKLKPNTKYYARAFITTDYGVSYSTQVPFTTYPQPSWAIDLGLPSGVLWSDHNLGGEKPGDFGGYYAWGETKEKSSYTVSNSQANGKTGSFISSVQPFILLPQYDAASVIWGNGWRLPTENELRELDSKCSKKYVTKQNSSGQTVYGIEFTGPNGNTIFLPASGHKEADRFIPLQCGYWSSEIPSLTSSWAYYMSFGESSATELTYITVNFGFSIRPVI